MVSPFSPHALRLSVMSRDNFLLFFYKADEQKMMAIMVSSANMAS